MAQTKRKRRTKHRGNAAGAIEARGRTGRKPTPAETKAAARTARQRKPPTWNSAAAKALAMSALLFILVKTGVLGNESSWSQAAFLSITALLIYTPLAYVTDKFVYNRLLKQQQRQQASKKR